MARFGVIECRSDGPNGDPYTPVPRPHPPTHSPSMTLPANVGRTDADTPALPAPRRRDVSQPNLPPAATCAEQKAAAVVEKLAAIKLPRAAEIVREGLGETLTYMNFPREHWRCIRTGSAPSRRPRRWSRS